MTHAASLTAPAVAAETRGSDYAELMRRVRGAGLLDRRHGYYLTKIGVTGGSSWAAGRVFVIMGDSWWQLAVAAFLAFVFTQLGFIGHDAGHRQIFRSRRANYLVGLLHGNLAIGLSYGWWVDKHNRHHAHPNQEGKDPDIAIGALAFTAGQAGAKRGVAPIHRASPAVPVLPAAPAGGACSCTCPASRRWPARDAPPGLGGRCCSPCTSPAT